MRRTPEEVPGVQLFTAECFRDERGFLVEAWVQSKLRARGKAEDRMVLNTDLAPTWLDYAGLPMPKGLWE